VRVIRTSKEEITVELSKREKLLLIKILELYPMVPSAHQQLSRGGGPTDQQSSQRLLDEALAEHREENRGHLREFLGDPRTFEQQRSGCRMHLHQGNLELLLQILNDIRVGCWIALGSPEEKLSVLDPKMAPQFWGMEVAGFIEASLLEAWESHGGI
jgi:hypothetical protein